MMHLFECISQNSVEKGWRRIHAALILAEDVILNGSPALAIEIASGLHVDLCQRLAFLEQFEIAKNHRVQKMMRSRARAVRMLIVSLNEKQQLHTEPQPELQPRPQDVTSTCPKSLPDQGDVASEDKGDVASDDAESACSTRDACESHESFSSDGRDFKKEETECVSSFLKDLQGTWLTKNGDDTDEVQISGCAATWANGSKAIIFEDSKFLYLHSEHLQEQIYASHYPGIDDDLITWSNGDLWCRPSTKDMHHLH